MSKDRHPHITEVTSGQTSTLESIKSDYQILEIRHHPVYGHQLLIDGDLQISESDHAYNVAMTAPLAGLGDLDRVLILGGGDGGVLNELLQMVERDGRQLERAIMVDIDEEVLRLSREYLPGICGEAFTHPRGQVIVDDAFNYIKNYRGLDAVIYDLTIDPVREERTRQEFIEDMVARIAESLKPGGIVNMQCCGTRSYDPQTGVVREELLQEVYSALEKKQFIKINEQRVWVPSFEEMWTFVSARKR